MKNQLFISIAAIMGALAVGIGAFGAHGLKAVLETTERTETFETAVKYHFYHALVLLVLAIWMRKEALKPLKLSFYFFVAGIFIFSGSLYVLSLTGITWLGAITPLGGLAFITGWLSLPFATTKKSLQA